MFFFFYTSLVFLSFFFFQAEDGIRDRDVTGVQTCALPISSRRGCLGTQARRARRGLAPEALQLVAREVRFVGAGVAGDHPGVIRAGRRLIEIGRASCRERV